MNQVSAVIVISLRYANTSKHPTVAISEIAIAAYKLMFSLSPKSAKASGCL